MFFIVSGEKTVPEHYGWVADRCEHTGGLVSMEVTAWVTYQTVYWTRVGKKAISEFSVRGSKCSYSHPGRLARYASIASTDLAMPELIAATALAELPAPAEGRNEPFQQSEIVRSAMLGFLARVENVNLPMRIRDLPIVLAFFAGLGLLIYGFILFAVATWLGWSVFAIGLALVFGTMGAVASRPRRLGVAAQQDSLVAQMAVLHASDFDVALAVSTIEQMRFETRDLRRILKPKPRPDLPTTSAEVQERWASNAVVDAGQAHLTMNLSNHLNILVVVGVLGFVFSLAALWIAGTPQGRSNSWIALGAFAIVVAGGAVLGPRRSVRRFVTKPLRRALTLVRATESGVETGIRQLESLHLPYANVATEERLLPERDVPSTSLFR